MATSTLTQRLSQLAADRGAPNGVEHELFLSFMRAATPQLRTAFRARHSDEEVFDILCQMLKTAQVLRSDPLVELHVADGSTVIQSVMSDQAFIVDTVMLTLRTQELDYHSGFNLVLGMGRNPEGELVSVDGESDPLESLIYVDTDGLEDHAPLKNELQSNLRLSKAVVGDFEAMTTLVTEKSTQLLRTSTEPTPEREAGFFLRWLLADNFVFMGAVHQGMRHGLTDKAVKGLTDTASIDQWDDPDRLVNIRKAEQESRVHRAGRLDEICIRLPDGSALKLQGLFTHRGVTQPSRHVPILREILTEILNDQDCKPSSYRYKGISNVFDSLPNEFLFTTPSDEIAEMIDRVLEAEQERRARAHIMQNQSNGNTFVLAAMPRGRWSDRVRQSIERQITAITGASYCDHGVFVGRYSTILVHFFLTGCARLTPQEVDDLSNDIVELATGWPERLHAALIADVASEKAERLSLRYANAFAEMYMRKTAPEQAARDVQMLESVNASNPVVGDIFTDGRNRINLRLYQLDNIMLSEMLPKLDNFGLVVIDQFADTVSPTGSQAYTIDTFRLEGVRGADNAALNDAAHQLVDAIEAVFTNRVTDDGLNQLILAANVSWQAVDTIRGYLGYARQLGLRYTPTRINEILLAQPELVRALWQYFAARFDPNLSGDRVRAMSEAKERFEALRRTLRNHDQDLTFRTLLNLVESTLRTNFYRNDRLEHYLSFKFDCSAIKQMPEPRMKFEVYVHHPEMEGVHLRGGPIARGGIRWSDREDYRREIHGLATTQMVKNVVIVPEGAKGGFYLKRSYADRAERRAEADRLYTFLIRGLLDITDNIVGGSIVHPDRVVRHDAHDNYLVVAADKGTAHLSDTANGVSQEYGFWLDDAFASGGSNGYDHKKVGITARGAWMTAKRHFAEMGTDPYRDPFTAIAIGDPAGDVFGNGVIESPHMKLLAAFNHLHIFIDPNPDPASSYEERLRMFKAVQGWEHYNTELISKGGGIFSRQAKSIKMTPEMKDLLGVMSDELDVDAVIRLILRIPADLLWNGGIGTYVKASHETHQQVGDSTNDSLRINADELRCKIIGEGGNLGLTQAGRVEFAQAGGRINTDAIDNSGGVDMSDHEVNLKILLSAVVDDGTLNHEERNTLLEELTEVVAEQVLDNSDTHAQQLSLDQIRSHRDPMFFSRTIDWVCKQSNTTRQALTLPSDDDLQRRTQNRSGLTRPELAVLQAHVKTHIFKELIASDESGIPHFDERVKGYFPPEIQERFGEYIPHHMLRRSIGMTVLITEVVGSAGVLFFPMLKEWTGASALEIARAWLLAMDIVNGSSIQAEIESCDASLDAKYRAWIEVQNAIAGVAAYALTAGETGLVGDPIDTIREVLRQLPRVRGAAHQEQLATMTQQQLERGIPESTAAKIAAMAKLTIAREIALLHQPNDRISHTVIRYISVGEATGILPALRKIRVEQTSGPWDQVALAILRNRFFALMRDLYAAIPLGPEVRLGVNRIKRRLIRKGPLGQLTTEVDRLLSARPDTAMLLVAEERIRGALASGLGDIDISSNGTATGARANDPEAGSNPATSSPAQAK